MPQRSRHTLLPESLATRWCGHSASGRFLARALLTLYMGSQLCGPAQTASRPGSSEISQHTILPVLMRHCWACHGPTVHESDLDLRSRSAMARGGSTGPALIPGNAEASLMIRRMRSGDCPPKKRLVEAGVKPMPESAIARIAEWIAAGAPEAADPPDLAGTVEDPAITAKDREHWSFRPPGEVEIPSVEQSDLVRNPIDAFVLDRLQAHGLSFAPEAPPQTLLRRICIDLTGLPPDPEFTQRFLSDSRPDVYERCVEDLLASPRYGERWGRHWLDVAGYSDVEGRREQHLPRPFGYRYRDYVIQAFNADKPYDRFLLEQLAGDELADYDTAPRITPELRDNLVATAFLRQGPDPTWANITGFVPDRLDVIADSMDVLGSGVMGLTLKCARCHDHKFDPIPQRDYYRLIDVFKGALDEYNWLKPDLRPYGGAANTGKLAERSLPFPPGVELAESKREGQTATLPRIAALWDRGDPSPTYIYRRGDYQRPMGVVHAGVPAVLAPPGFRLDVQPPWPDSKKTGRRLAFARWLTSRNHPLTSRVLVNRVWRHHFGRGLVRTLDNFGLAGAPPTHPELLDWLAMEFMRQGWQIKALHRLIVTSRTYRQASRISPEAARQDPENLWWSRMSMRRLEAEPLWDSCVFVAGALDDSAFGPAVPVEIRKDGSSAPGRSQSGWRRSIYGEQVRKAIPVLLEAFDLPPMNPNCVSRAESIVPTQALHLLNDPLLFELGERFAARLIQEAGESHAARVELAFRLALARPPSAVELSDALRVLQVEPPIALAPAAPETRGSMPLEASSQHATLAAFCRMLLNSAEFLYVD